MATLEDAAEELVVKLKGLDGEIEESTHALEDLRERVESASDDVEREWSALTEAVSSFLDKVHEEQQHLGREAAEALQAVADTDQAVQDDDSEARAEIKHGRDGLEALAAHAANLEPRLESTVAEGGESPAHELAQRAREIEQELERVVDETRTFLQDEVVAGLEEVTDHLRERASDLHRSFTEDAAAALQEALGGWEHQVDELETFVATQAFTASHENAGEYVEWAVDECQAAMAEQLDALQQLAQVLSGQLQELAAEVQGSADLVVDQSGTELVGHLGETGQAVQGALDALGSVRDLLAQYSFVQI